MTTDGPRLIDLMATFEPSPEMAVDICIQALETNLQGPPFPGRTASQRFLVAELKEKWRKYVDATELYSDATTVDAPVAASIPEG